MFILSGVDLSQLDWAKDWFCPLCLDYKEKYLF